MEEETQGLLLIIISVCCVGVIFLAIKHYHPELLQRVGEFLTGRSTVF